jgi:hypothetical protein
VDIKAILGRARRTNVNRAFQLVFALRRTRPSWAYAIYAEHSGSMSVDQRVRCLSFLAGSEKSADCARELLDIEREHGSTPEIAAALALHYHSCGEKAAALHRIAYVRAHRNLPTDVVIEERIKRMPDR